MAHGTHWSTLSSSAIRAALFPYTNRLDGEQPPGIAHYACLCAASPTHPSRSSAVVHHCLAPVTILLPLAQIPAPVSTSCSWLPSA